VCASPIPFSFRHGQNLPMLMPFLAHNRLLAIPNFCSNVLFVPPSGSFPRYYFTITIIRRLLPSLSGPSDRERGPGSPRINATFPRLPPCETSYESRQINRPAQSSSGPTYSMHAGISGQHSEYPHRTANKHRPPQAPKSCALPLLRFAPLHFTSSVPLPKAMASPKFFVFRFLE